MIDDDMLQYHFMEPECEVIEAEEEEEVKTPTFGHVFGYPASAPSLTMIGMYAGIPLVVVLLASLIPLAPFQVGFLILGLVFQMIVVLSLLLYLTNCVRSVADGEFDPPSLFEVSEDEDFWGLLRQCRLIVSAGAMCFLPSFVAMFTVDSYTPSHDGVPFLFWNLSYEAVWTFFGVFALGVFFYPMCLLSVVMVDSLGGLNPVFIIGSVFSTFGSYLLVALLFLVPMVLVMATSLFKFILPHPLILFVLRLIAGYLLMMDAYILGWFFYKNEDKLRWDV